jgi:hypothetical protein
MSFPKKGKFFPDGNGGSGGGGLPGERVFASEVSAALHRALGPTHAGIKTVAAWTGANERTVKNWFSGRYGPSGEHLAVLVQHSDEVLNAFLSLAGRQDLMVAIKLAAAEQAIMEVLIALRHLMQDRDGGRLDSADNRE